MAEYLIASWEREVDAGRRENAFWALGYMQVSDHPWK
jgi:hypothetical protein